MSCLFIKYLSFSTGIFVIWIEFEGMSDKLKHMEIENMNRTWKCQLKCSNLFQFKRRMNRIYTPKITFVFIMTFYRAINLAKNILVDYRFKCTCASGMHSEFPVFNWRRVLVLHKSRQILIDACKNYQRLFTCAHFKLFTFIWKHCMAGAIYSQQNSRYVGYLISISPKNFGHLIRNGME